MGHSGPPDTPITIAPGYGQSSHYLGPAGEHYFAWQAADGIAGGELEARKLRPLLGTPQSVLDFGCGGGFLLDVLRRTIPVVSGVEPNPAARAECIRRGLEVGASLGDFAGRRFDAIVSNHCLEHVPYPIEALRQMKACLAAEGVLVLALPIDDWRTQRDFRRPDVNHHLHTWTPLLIRHSLMEAGLETVRADVLTSAWPRSWQTLSRLLPAPAFDVACTVWGWLTRRRQLLVIARHPI
jgi:SAM-dependent methyltransferase